MPGEVTSDKLDVLRKADAVFLDEIRNAGVIHDITSKNPPARSREGKRRAPLPSQ
jgi:GMP synthase PP-ATPase subunit